MNDQTALVTVEKPNEDDKLIRMWLMGKSPNTARAYSRTIADFRRNGIPLQGVGLADLQEYVSELQGEDATLALAYNALKSLWTFGTELGYFTVNVAKALKTPKPASELAQRILTETEVIRMIDRETNPRNHALLRLLYHAGLRVTEIVNLRWEHVRETDKGAVLDIQKGKGTKQRYVPISQDMYAELCKLDGRYLGKDRYVFQSRKGKGGTLPMDESQIDRIVLAAAKRAGIDGHVSAHWLRHSNATHAIKNGAPIHVVQQSLGHASILTTQRYLHIDPDNGSSQYLKI